MGAEGEEMTDVVAELDRWLAHSGAKRWDAEERMVLRARDEIAALREAKLARPSAYDIVRTAALEEAARMCERRRDTTGEQSAYAVLDVQSYTSACSGCAYDIRALKDERDD
jgi:hypothetical protein